MAALFGAVDIGASSGRVIAAVFKSGKLNLTEVYRFSNQPKQAGDRLVWDFDFIMSEIRLGLRELGARAERLDLEVTSIGIDTWAVDYGLLRDGELVANPNCYRDPQNSLGVELVHARCGFDELYQVNGLQFLAFNSIYQLAKHKALFPREFQSADQIVLLPDLIGYQLTGLLATERTNASSTGLLDATTGEWSRELAEKLEIDIELFPQLVCAGEVLGNLLAGFGPRLSNTRVVHVGSHDTASAVVGAPSTKSNFAFISSGTWSLLGAEIEQPILTAESREANFTNELGVDGRVRYLKNLSGLWLLSECMRFWEESSNPQELDQLLHEARKVGNPSQIDVSDPALVAPGDMPLRILRQLEAAGQPLPQSPAEFVASILHSLAKAYAGSFAELERLTGLRFKELFVTGGGSQNQYLCELTAEYCKVNVIAGPVESTALGNVLVQLRAAGMAGPTLEDLRALILKSDFELTRYSMKDN